MIIARSIIAGLGFVLITATAVPIITCVYLSATAHDQGTIGFDVVSMAKLPVVWIILGGAFAIGFCLRHLRLQAKK